MCLVQRLPEFKIGRGNRSVGPASVLLVRRHQSAATPQITGRETRQIERPLAKQGSACRHAHNHVLPSMLTRCCLLLKCMAENATESGGGAAVGGGEANHGVAFRIDIKSRIPSRIEKRVRRKEEEGKRGSLSG